MSEDGFATCNYLFQDKTQRKYRNIIDSLEQSFFYFKIQCDLQEERHLFIYISALERKRGRVGA